MAKLSVQQMETEGVITRPTRTDRISLQQKYKKLNQPQLTEEQYVAEQKKLNATETIDEINEKIAEYKKQKEYYDQRYRDTSDPEQASQYDQDRVRYQSYITELQKVKKYAQTGDYDKNSVIGYAMEVAMARYERIKPAPASERLKIAELQKQEIKEMEEKGYEPVIKRVGTKDVIKSYKFNPKADKEYLIVQEIKPDKLEPTTAKIYVKGSSGDYKTVGEVNIDKIEQKALQDQAFKEWKEKNKTKPIYSDFQQIDTSQQGYITRGTISDQPRVDYIPITPDSVGNDSKFISSLKKYWDKIPSGYAYINPLGINKFGGVNAGGISFFPTSDKSIKLKDVKEDVVNFLDEKAREKFEQEILRTGLKEKTDVTFQEEYQTRFERKYMKDLIYDKKDFETASKEFEESDEAKIIQKKYGMAIEKGRAGKFTKEGFAIAGLGIGSLGVRLIPTTLKGAVGEGVLIYTGAKVLKAIPPIVSNLGTAGIGAIGTFQAFSPTGSPESKAGGVITAGISFGALGYQGVKYLRRPTVKVVKIPSGRSTLRSSSTIGKDVKVITDQKEINKIIYQQQKLSQTGIAGRRTIVSTKWRDYLKLDPVYKGIPYAQRGTTYSFKGLRGSYSFTTKGGYQKAMDLLIKRGGYTPYQASQTLRYYQPKVIEQYLNKGSLTIKGNQAFGSFEYLTKQPVINIDKSLGIKTRGARTISDYYSVERKLLNLKSGSVVVQDQVRTSLFLKRGSSPMAFKDFQFSKGILYGKGSELKKGYDILKTDIKGLQGFEKITYKDLTGVSISKNIFPSDKVLRIDISQTKLINKLIDLRAKGFIIKPANIKKTPFSKTFGSPDIKVQSVKNIIKRSSVGGSTGSQTTKQITDNVLKQAISPPEVSVKSIKNLIKVDQGSKIVSGIKSSTLSIVGLEQSQSLKNALKQSMDLKQLQVLKKPSKIKQASSIKQIIKSDIKIKQQQKSLLKSDLLLLKGLEAESLRSRDFFPPPPKTPTPIPFPILFPSGSSKKDKKKLNRMIQDYAYLPDFTSRAIGLKEEILTEAQAKKKIKQLLTGFEIRRPVKIKY